jgi:hypothetical protein
MADGKKRRRRGVDLIDTNGYSLKQGCEIHTSNGSH